MTDTSQVRRVLGSSLLVCAVLLALVPTAGARVGATASLRTPPVACGDGLVRAGRGCTHGGDLVPPNVERIATRAMAPAASTPKQMCVANGRGGRRIRVFYGYPAGTESRSAAFRSWISQSVAMADANLDEQTPGIAGQHLRMYCKEDRGVTVSALELLPIGTDGVFTFQDVMDSLLQRVANGLGDEDFDTPRFTYVVFVDNIGCCYGPSGQAMLWGDDRPDPALNLNNQVMYSPRFAMVEIGGSTFSGAYIFLHEVGHTLGAVQDSAPHSSRAGHCYTSSDVMCYADGGPYYDEGGSMQAVCAAMPDGQFAFDCEGGDYYEVHPDPGSYLASAWNTSDSGWLTKPG